MEIRDLSMDNFPVTMNNIKKLIILYMKSQLPFGRYASYTKRCTNESANILTEKCLEDSKEMAVKYPDLTKAYCKCSTAKIQAEFTLAEYIEIIKIGIEEQKQKL